MALIKNKATVMREKLEVIKSVDPVEAGRLQECIIMEDSKHADYRVRKVFIWISNLARPSS